MITTEEQRENIFERSKDDRAMIVGSEVRSLINDLRTYDSVVKKQAVEIEKLNKVLLAAQRVEATAQENSDGTYEVPRDVILQTRAAIYEDTCACGHRYSSHGQSHDVQWCSAADCKCSQYVYGGYPPPAKEVIQTVELPIVDLREKANELSKTMICNCDLDNWTPEPNTGHSWVCRIHKALTEEKRV